MKPQTKPAVTAIAIPSYAQALARPLPEIQDRQTPYVKSASPRSPDWDAQKAAGLADGDLFIVKDGQMVKANPLKFHLLTAAKFYTQMDSQGNVIAASREEKRGAMPKFDEHYVAVVLLIHNGKLIPSRSEFRSTKSGIMTTPIATLTKISDPASDWPNLSEAHKLSAQFPEPWGRFVATARTERKVARASGNPYFAGKASVTPSTIEDMQRLKAAFLEDSFKIGVQLAIDSFTERVAALEALIK